MGIMWWRWRMAGFGCPEAHSAGAQTRVSVPHRSRFSARENPPVARALPNVAQTLLSVPCGVAAPWSLDVTTPRQRLKKVDRGASAFCENPWTALSLENVPRQRHWMESPITPVPPTRHQTTTSLYQGCSQKTLAPLATVFLPLTRQTCSAAAPEKNVR